MFQSYIVASLSLLNSSNDYFELQKCYAPSGYIYDVFSLILGATLEKEVTRFVRSYPEEVCHIPRALDFFLTPEGLENDSSELSWILTWARVSPVKALSLLCPRNLPSHPLTAQFAVRVLNSYPSDAVLFYIQQMVISIEIKLSKFEIKQSMLEIKQFFA